MFMRSIICIAVAMISLSAVAYDEHDVDCVHSISEIICKSEKTNFSDESDVCSAVVSARLRTGKNADIKVKQNIKGNLDSDIINTSEATLGDIYKKLTLKATLRKQAQEAVEMKLYPYTTLEKCSE